MSSGCLPRCVDGQKIKQARWTERDTLILAVEIHFDWNNPGLYSRRDSGLAKVNRLPYISSISFVCGGY